MSETEPLFYTHIATTATAVSYLAYCFYSKEMKVPAMFITTCLLMFLFSIMLMGLIYWGNLNTVTDLPDNVVANINRFHWIAANCMGLFLLVCLLKCANILASISHNNHEDEDMKDLPLGYNLKVELNDSNFHEGKVNLINGVDDMTSYLEKIPEQDPKNALSRSEYEGVKAIPNRGVSTLVMISTLVFLVWMHAMFIVIECQKFIPGRNNVFTNSNIIAITANVVSFVSLCVSLMIDSGDDKSFVGVKFDGLFGFHSNSGDMGDDEMVSLKGSQLWVYLPWLFILCFEFLSLSCMLEFYNGIDHLIVYLGFVILGYLMVAYTTSCATWLEIRVFVTSIFYSSAVFYPSVIDSVANTFPEKANNTLSGQNVQYAILDYWGNTDLQYRTYFPNGTIDVETTGAVATVVSSTALCLSFVFMLQVVFNCWKRQKKESTGVTPM